MDVIKDIEENLQSQGFLTDNGIVTETVSQSTQDRGVYGNDTEVVASSLCISDGRGNSNGNITLREGDNVTIGVQGSQSTSEGGEVDKDKEAVACSQTSTDGMHDANGTEVVEKVACSQYSTDGVQDANGTEVVGIAACSQTSTNGVEDANGSEAVEVVTCSQSSSNGVEDANGTEAVEVVACSQPTTKGEEDDSCVNSLTAPQAQFTQTDTEYREPVRLPIEESNFLRFCHLIQKLAPEAVRHRFDQEFPPNDLNSIIQRNKTTLNDLKFRRVITNQQFNLIFPHGSIPVSSSFDLTLMLCLFRNLTNMSHISRKYDSLPPPSDLTLGADLARIKYYRNKIAHYTEEDRKLDSHDFTIVWGDVSKAVGRIGGVRYEQQCTTLLSTSLDSSYLDIYREFVDLLSEHSEKLSIQSDQIEILECKQTELETKLSDPITPNERDKINRLIKDWESRDKLFAATGASEHLNEILTNEKVVIVTGCPGSGKSFTVQHALLSLKSDGYDVIPVSSSTDMVRFFTGKNKQVFFIDNLCGKYNIIMNDIEEWERNNEKVKAMFVSPLLKCIFTSRLQVYQDPKFKNLNLEAYKVVNLSGAFQLSLQDKKLVAQQYFDEEVLKKISDKVIDNSLCFPLLCSLFKEHSNGKIGFFERPKSYFFDALNEMKDRLDKTKYACIVLCVLFNNTVPLDTFSLTIDKKVAQILNHVFEELQVNETTLTKTLTSQFESMIGSYFIKSDRGYTCIHDYLFDMLCLHVAETMLECVINYGDSKLLSERALLESLKTCNESAIVIPSDKEQMFFNRILKDANSREIWNVFGCTEYGYKLLTHLVEVKGQKSSVEVSLDKRAEVNRCDDKAFSYIYAASQEGDHAILEMLCNRGGDVNLCSKDGQSPLYIASLNGQKSCVEVLLKKGAEVNRCTENEGFSPLHAASFTGSHDIIEIVCNGGGKVNLCSKDGMSPLYTASISNHKSCVEIFLDKGAEVNRRTNKGFSPLHAASSEGYHDIVETLCNRGGDVNLCNKDGVSPLLIASFHGHKSCVKVLLDNGADVNRCDVDGTSPLSAASLKGYHDIVKML